FLGQNETLTITYQTSVTDSFNATASRPITVTIFGTDDPPQVAPDSSGPHTITEVPGMAGNPAVNAIPTGSLSFTDADLTDQHTTSSSLALMAWSGGDATIPVNGALNNAFNTAMMHDTTGGGSGIVTFGFGVADSTFDFLAQEETLTITYNVQVLDPGWT